MDQEPVAVYDTEGKPTARQYIIVNIKNNVARLEHIRTNQRLRVHTSRIVPEDQIKMFKCPCGKESSSQSGLTLHMKNCPEGSKTMAKSPSKQKKAEPAASKVEAFDINSFVKTNGGEHHIRGEDGSIKFDHNDYKVLTHAVMDEKTGFYHIFNTYTYPDGTVTLGKGGKGITKYPLKGKSVNYTVSQRAKNEASRGEKRQRKGGKTADEVRKGWVKNGYVKK